MATVTISELQRNARSVVDSCVATGESVGVTRYGETPVTIVKTERYKELLRRELSAYDREMRIESALLRGYEDFLADRIVSADDAIAQLDALDLLEKALMDAISRSRMEPEE